MTKISIVIPAYNAERYIGEALESVFAQTMAPYEIIVVDDGSTDRTAEIVRSFDKEVHYIKQQNQGVSVARNTGIQAATGDWIALLDSDDLLRPEKIERQIARIESTPNLVVVYSAFTFLYADGATVESPVFPAQNLWPALRYRTPILPSTAIIRRSALDEVGAFPVGIKYAEDWQIWLRLIRRYGKSAFQGVPESLTLYRCWDNNASRNFKPMAEATLGMLDTILLKDLTGLRRIIWKRRIEARFYYGIALSLRSIQDDHYWEFVIESFLQWPFCGSMIPAHRYLVFLHMLWTRMRSFRFCFRYWWPIRKCREHLMSENNGCCVNK
jgi:glycosyltransferase involved in cell wall biosynthesis